VRANQNRSLALKLETVEMPKSQFVSDIQQVPLISRRPVRVDLALALAVALLAPAALYSAPNCVAPPDMKDRLQNSPTADDFADLGLWFADHEQYACAADAYATSLQTDPNQKNATRVIFMFGSSLYLSGDSQEAVPALQEAESRGYKDNRIHLLLAAALDATHNSAGAEAEWRAALDFDPEITAALDALSTDLVNDANYASVIDLLDKPRVQPQRTPTQCVNLALAYTRTGKSGQAIEVLRNGLNTAPDSAAIAGQLAGLLILVGRDEEAASVLELALNHNPDDPRLHEAMGTVLARLKRMPEARQHLERAIALGDTTPEAKDNLAKVIQAIGAAPAAPSVP
jgi:Flp pilus assembly protein TadD